MPAARLPRLPAASRGSQRPLIWLLTACTVTFVGVILAFRPAAPVAQALPDAEAVESSNPQAEAAYPSSRAWNRGPLRETTVARIAPSPFQANTMPAQATGAAGAEDRAAAIREMDAAEPENYAALEMAVRNDPAPANRMLAVSALLQQGLRAEDPSGAREILKGALNDQDPGVAATARDAFLKLQSLNP